MKLVLLSLARSMFLCIYWPLSPSPASLCLGPPPDFTHARAQGDFSLVAEGGGEKERARREDAFSSHHQSNFSCTSRSRSILSSSRECLLAQDHRLWSPTLSFMDKKTEAHREAEGMTIQKLHAKQTMEQMPSPLWAPDMNPLQIPPILGKEPLLLLGRLDANVCERLYGH